MAKCAYDDKQIELLTDKLIESFDKKITRAEAKDLVIKDWAFKMQMTQYNETNKEYINFPRELKKAAQDYLSSDSLTKGDLDEAQNLYDNIYYGDEAFGNEQQKSLFDRKFSNNKVDEFYVNKDVISLAREVGMEIPKKPSEVSGTNPIEAAQMSIEQQELNEEKQVETVLDDFGIKSRLDQTLADKKESMLQRNLAMKEYLEAKSKMDAEINWTEYNERGDYRDDELQVLMNVDESTPDGKEIEVEDLKLNFDSVSKLLDSKSIEPKDNSIRNLIDTPEKFNNIFGLQVANEVKSSYFTLGKNLRKGLSYTRLELANQNPIDAVADSFAGLNDATKAKQEKLLSKTDGKKIKTHNNVIDSILSGRLTEKNKFETEMNETIKSLVNIAPDIDITTEEKTFTFKSNNQPVSAKDFDQIAHQVYLQNTHNMGYEDSVKSIASIDIQKEFQHIPSEFQSRILNINDTAMKLSEIKRTLSENESDVLKNLRSLNKISKLPQADLDKVNFNSMYKDTLGIASDQLKTEVSDMVYQMKSMTIDNFDKYDITNYQKAMDNMVATRDDMFSIDATEELKTNRNKTIYDNFYNGKTMYISVDNLSKTFTVNSVVNVTHKDEVLNPDGSVKTKEQIRVIDKPILKYNVLKDTDIVYEDVLDNIAKRKIDKDKLSKEEFASLSIKERISYMSEIAKENQNTLDRNKRQYKLYKNKITSSDVDMLSKYVPSMLDKSNVIWKTKPGVDEFSSAASMDMLNKYIKRLGMTDLNKTYLTKADNNIINNEFGVAKETIVSDTPSGKRFTTINESTKGGQPAVMMMDVDHMNSKDFWTVTSEDESEDTKHVYRVQYKVGSLGWTKPSYYIEGEDNMYDHIDAVHKYNNQTNIGDETVAAKKVKAISAYKKTLVNEAMQKIYTVMTDGLQSKDEVVDKVQEIINDTLDDQKDLSYTKSDSDVENEMRETYIDQMKSNGFNEKQIERKLVKYDKTRSAKNKIITDKSKASVQEVNKGYISKLMDNIKSNKNIKSPEETLHTLTALSDYMFGQQNKLHAINTQELLDTATTFVDYLYNKDVVRPTDVTNKIMEALTGEQPRQYDRSKDIAWVKSKTLPHEQAIDKLVLSGEYLAEDINTIDNDIKSNGSLLKTMSDVSHYSKLKQGSDLIKELVQLESTTDDSLVKRDDERVLDIFSKKNIKYKNVDIKSIPVARRADAIDTYMDEQKLSWSNGASTDTSDEAWTKRMQEIVNKKTFSEDVVQSYIKSENANRLSDLALLKQKAESNIEKYNSVIKSNKNSLSKIDSESLSDKDINFNARLNSMLSDKLSYNKKLISGIDKAIKTINDEIHSDKRRRSNLLLSESDYKSALDKINETKTSLDKIKSLSNKLVEVSDAIKQIESNPTSIVNKRIQLQKTIDKLLSDKDSKIESLNKINSDIKNHTYKIDFYNSAANVYGEKLLLKSMQDDITTGRSLPSDKSIKPVYKEPGNPDSGKSGYVLRSMDDNRVTLNDEYNKNDEFVNNVMPESYFDETYSTKQNEVGSYEASDENEIKDYANDKDELKEGQLDLLGENSITGRDAIENVEGDAVKLEPISKDLINEDQRDRVQLSDPDRIVNSVEDLDAYDAQLFSAKKLMLDRSIKMQHNKININNNSELEKELSKQSEEFETKMSNEETSEGRYTFNKEPGLIHNIATVFNVAKPFLEVEYAKTIKENQIYNMNSAEPQVRLREEVLKNKKGVC